MNISPANLQQMIPAKPVVLDATDGTAANTTRGVFEHEYFGNNNCNLHYSDRPSQVSYGSASYGVSASNRQRRDTPYSKMKCFLHHGRYDYYCSTLNVGRQQKRKGQQSRDKRMLMSNRCRDSGGSQTKLFENNSRRKDTVTLVYIIC